MNRLSMTACVVLIAVVGISTAFAETNPEQPSASEAIVQDNSEQRLQDALVGVTSNSASVRQASIERLIGVHDDRATSAIIALATNGEGDDRVVATSALWLHAADFQFADTNSIAALQSLAEDTDPQVSRIANNALADMDQYQAK